ncbi:MAG: hypothetical protein PHD50_04295 [Bacilli bacterium]|nr:hypothetical protein [Bacilli bacterium]
MENLKQVFEEKYKKAKSNRATAIFGTIFSGIIMIGSLIVVLFVENGGQLLYGVGLGLLVFIITVFNVYLETKDMKTFKKAIENPEEYKNLLDEKKPVYLEDSELENKTIGGKVKSKRGFKYEEHHANKNNDKKDDE